ncbi:flagellar basal body rod protein FlgC [Chitinilyticum litopenaei]|uniref:flagellar basal body rod protein FlgC n=1 Tax=Chitinilyticum litopenaei TaxID=1121276 RepID=UPI0004071915|nr:flagellar basal body rod protein FlgC [Chitinilyticum litopenaei]
MFRVFDIASSAVHAQSARLNAVASNLANAESVTSSNGQPYRAKQVVFQAAPVGAAGKSGVGVKVAGVIEDQAPPKLSYEPHNPLADANGYVARPNVDVVEEMTNMISASRSYQINVDVMNTAKTLLMRTIAIGQS